MMDKYILKRSRRKTVSLTVKPDCTVVVSAPFKMSEKQIDEFVNKNHTWIEKQRIRLSEIEMYKQSFVLDYGTEVYFFGKKLPVLSEETRKAKLTPTHIAMPQGLDSTQIKQRLITLYRETAREYIGSRLPHYSNLTGISASKLTITSAKTNWGSCTADRLHFSWHLIMAEKEIIDYVIIHELSHIKHHNHSDAFWYEVSRFCPEWKKLRSKLKFYSEILSREGWCD